MFDKSALKDLVGKLRGAVIRPADAGYEEARRVWNGMIDRRPAVIVRCADADDVARSVRFAATHGLPLAVRGGGHNVAGFGTCDGGMVIDLGAMKAISVEPAARTVRAQGGLRWGEFDAATQQHALATTGGLVSTTGIGGFTLGGGIGWLMRKHGLALDNVQSVEMVTAAGERLTANEGTNADLFWGVRGGGGNFGVVTEFTYRLHPVGPEVFGGVAFYPAAQAADLLGFYRGWVPTLPDELTTMVIFATAPAAPFVPVPMQGTPLVGVAMCHCGSVAEGQALARPLREFATPAIDLLGPVPYTGLQTMFDATAPAGLLNYWKTEYLGGLEDAAVQTLVEGAARMGSPFSQVHVHHVEGAVNRVANDATAFARRDAPFILNIIGMWQDANGTDRNVTWAREFAESVRPSSTGAAYLNFIGETGEDRVRAVYGEEKYARLVALKDRYDPQNLFRVNQNIKPSA